MVYDHVRIAKHYCRGSFVVDLLSTIPLDLITREMLDGSSTALRAVRPCLACNDLPAGIAFTHCTQAPT